MTARRVRIPDDELNWKFTRSSGPGGQHVNTSDTRVELRWSLDRTTVLDEAEKQRVRERLRSRLRDGTITVVSSQYRSQHRNRETARARLIDLVEAAITPAKRRRPTRVSKAADQRRLDAKRRRGDIKRQRRMEP
ncbi:aminoacyl-tRNA hydrolase [Aeromicrobium sp. YIM 150415]|uniref:alternative ribosome rescue aminoacyl-tRNA hydrolase ArfB n=1 Tax=Aeromicrobium sp. YIM 150415 TaxID=2803912 RepID=UPI0019654C56|nr:alternative ribosome rescue aminoacyl-tRNA hydrolase ArfB [Aeromicrobium sp. YIM 150415]MBM9462997.1 aminoacyl-tRNA hydrolase [Aeromicrobium sp. YIM 150415]